MTQTIAVPGSSVGVPSFDPPRAAPGRPRDPSLDEAILAASYELLGRVGYRRLSVDAVARLAGVSRTTLRLRWRTKAELVFDTVFPDADKLRVPDTGSLDGDLRGCVRNSIAVYESSAVGAAFQGLIDDCRHEPEVARAILTRIYAPSLKGFAQLIERGVERGEIAARIDADVLFDVIAGALLYRLSVSMLDLGRLEDQLVDLLCRALGSR
jgi:AcrR family transcriptional regulator